MKKEYNDPTLIVYEYSAKEEVRTDLSNFNDLYTGDDYHV